MAGKWQEIVTDVAIGGVVGASGQFFADRLASGADRQKAFGLTGAVAAALGLGLKVWSTQDRGNFPGWKDDVGDPLLVSGSTLAGLVGMRRIDRAMDVTATTTPYAGLLNPDQYTEAVAAGDLPSGIPETGGGYPLSPAQLQTALTDNPDLVYSKSEGMWDDPNTTDDWTTGG